MIDVSIVIPTYNRESRLVDAIESCLANDSLDLEIIVVDDGSTDDTRDRLVEHFSDWSLIENDDGFMLAKASNQISYVYQNNSGAPAARNNGLCRATGKYIKFLDSDDLLISGALAKEHAFAEQNHADVVVTGWIDLFVDENNERLSEQSRPAPELANGIDDMLEGQGPWTAAALYKASSISHLRWDESVEKAQEWMWAWDVCLFGLPFTKLDIDSAYYMHYPSVRRITQQGNSLLRSTEWRLKILYKVEAVLRDKDLLTPSRAKKLAQYYYKDARVVCDKCVDEWGQLSKRIESLGKGVPKDGTVCGRSFLRIFGLEKGVYLFVKCRNIVNKLIFYRKRIR